MCSMCIEIFSKLIEFGNCVYRVCAAIGCAVWELVRRPCDFICWYSCRWRDFIVVANECGIIVAHYFLSALFFMHNHKENEKDEWKILWTVAFTPVIFDDFRSPNFYCRFNVNERYFAVNCSQRQIEWFLSSDWNALHYPKCDESLWLIRVWNVHTSTVNAVVVNLIAFISFSAQSDRDVRSVFFFLSYAFIRN